MMDYTVNYKRSGQLIVAEDINVLSSKFYDILLDIIQKNSVSDRRFSLALSGGSTPLKIYKELIPVLKKSGIIDKIDFYWSDERCVNPKSMESNYGNAYRTFLQPLGICEKHIYRIRGEDNPNKESMRYEQLLIENLNARDTIPAFDLIMLGLGDDGHTASIFPDQIDLINAENLVATAKHPETGQNRITFTGKLINNSSHVIFIVSGRKKKKVLQEILYDKQAAGKYPARHIRPKTGNLIWLCDRDAVGNGLS